jgi:hypothetical protein
MPYFESTDDVYEIYRTACLIDGKVKMHGTFRPANLPDFTYDHIFIPSEDGDLVQVIPVFDGCRVVDIVAISGSCWGCVSGAGNYLGTITRRVYDSLAEWMTGDEVGVLPLKKSFLA